MRMRIVKLPSKPIAEFDSLRVAKRIEDFIQFYWDQYGTCEKLEEVTKVPATTIRSWTYMLKRDPNGDNLPKMRIFGQFCAALGWSLSDVMELIEGEQPIQEFLEKKLKLVKRRKSRVSSASSESLAFENAIQVAANSLTNSNGVLHGVKP